jgi:hypothetical protein
MFVGDRGIGHPAADIDLVTPKIRIRKGVVGNED